MENLQQIVEPHYQWFQNEFVEPQYQWFHNEFVPPVIQFWQRLDVPDWVEYSDAAKTCGNDIIRSSRSTFELLYLTFRPIAILTWIILQALFYVCKVLFKLLLEEGWISLKKGGKQAKHASIWFYKFQCSLSRTELLGELGVIVTLILLYYLRKWLKRQTYWARTMKWFREKKRRVVQTYTKTLHKVAEVSMLLAMTLPHLIFIGLGVATRIFLPSFCKWLALDTYSTTILSICYPLICTLGWIHQDRYQNQNTTETEDDKKNLASSVAGAPSSPASSSERKTAAQQAKEEFAKKRGIFGRGITSTAKDNKATSSSSVSVVSSVSGYQRTHIPESSNSGTKYWLRYWVFFALVQAFGVTCSMIPIFGRFVALHPFVLSLGAELKLLFFVWMFGMEKLLGNTKEDALLAKALPMRLLHKHVTPILLEFDSRISEAVSKEQWTSIVHSKAKRLLEVFVMVRFMKESFKDWLLHIIDESRVLVLPCITLLMPGYITQFGVAYVQFVISSAKSARAVNKTEKSRILYLKYWVLHCVFSGFLNWFSSIIWWIPFSTHIVFLLWCHLSFPQTIAQYYPILEMELVAFGLLKGGHGKKKLDLTETLSVRVVSSLVKRLPSAASTIDDNQKDDDTKKKNGDDDTKKKKGDDDTKKKKGDDEPGPETNKNASSSDGADDETTMMKDDDDESDLVTLENKNQQSSPTASDVASLAQE